MGSAGRTRKRKRSGAGNEHATTSNGSQESPNQKEVMRRKLKQREGTQQGSGRGAWPVTEVWKDGGISTYERFGGINPKGELRRRSAPVHEGQDRIKGDRVF